MTRHERPQAMLRTCGSFPAQVCLRLHYLEQEGKVIYTGKDKKTSKSFPAMEWLAAMCTHIPNRGEQMVRHYGYYSNVARGKRKREASDDLIPCILETVENDKALRKNCLCPSG